ncbi:RNA polymerase sigma factor [Microbacterium sp. NPDC055988]|uniref:RNA polymerase sigma factor n=1 Tax=Microbacterium sp. NPDC055988 TaxID=3345671 RepID=UPI0035DCBFD7
MKFVDPWLPYVRARVVASEVDDVMQTIRETVLSRASRYDSAQGEPGAWVFGVVRVTVKAARRVHAVACERAAIVEVDETIPDRGVAAGDPLAFLIEHREELEWVRIVAEASTSFEWQVVVTFARTEGTGVEVASALGVPITTVRSARERVTALIRTAIGAINARDNATPITLSGCIPGEGGYREALPFRDSEESVAATALGLSASTFRKRRAMLRRLQSIVDVIRATAMLPHETATQGEAS